MSERQDRLESQTKDILDASQDIQDLIPATAGDHAWEEIRQQWRTARDDLEEMISKDKGVETELSEFRRNKYGKIINRLVELGKIDQKRADNLTTMEGIYLEHRNRKRDVTPDTLAKFQAAARAAK